MSNRLYTISMTTDSSLRLSFVFFLALAAALFCMTQMAQAQDTSYPQSTVAAQPQAEQQTPYSMPPKDDSEVTILRDNYSGKYQSATLENLSKLYWRLGAFDLDDNVAVSNFIKINDCKIYTEYLNDDLEWKEIVNVMKGHITKIRESYPLNYQFVIQINLGRYDPALGGFPLVNRTGFTDAKRIEVSSIDRNKSVCFDESPVQDYPKSVIILLPEAFTMNFIKLDEHVAQAYILRKKAEFNALDEAVRNRSYERDAYIRLRVTFSQYNGNLRGDNNQIMSIMYGKIDGYEIFEDASQKRLMVSVDLNSDKTARAPQMSVPSPSFTGTVTPVSAVSR
ncbi:MAG: hypothetical protein DI626_03745 [Micavibrio aeruginosavorus]|uniref:DUF4852 domain-containing protein n=1 Tax=Micavibrio aeruginosavorus TaxID=349221 RepID=A0A2W5BWR6_9BACT|nr:MAG: hypothetical protein DI626_03745 [Micavibrio aeruginosavorus]